MAKEYIEREAFRNHISNTDWYSINKDGSLIAGASDGDTALFKARDIFEAIHEQPAVDVVEVKHGTWTLHKNGSGTCDQCHFTQKGVWDYDNWQRYCGCCGARMDNIVC